MRYMYPENLKSKATLFLWELKDISVISFVGLLSLVILSQAGVLLPSVFTVVYAFLTIQYEGVSILNFIIYASTFFFIKNQMYEWRQ